MEPFWSETRNATLVDFILQESAGRCMKKNIAKMTFSLLFEKMKFWLDFLFEGQMTSAVRMTSVRVRGR